MMSTPFALTVPGTDKRLVPASDRLVHGEQVYRPMMHGIWDLTREQDRAELDRFASAYATVRRVEGRELDAAAVRALPDIAPDHPLAEMWAHRRSSWDRLAAVLPAPEAPALAIDVGAGCGWSAARLAARGWTAAAMDITVEGGDGLAAARHHEAELLLIRADMGALPFATASIDLAVYNASLHYALDIGAALDEAFRVLRPGGTLAVLDSPVFHDPVAGAKMVEEFDRVTQRRHGVEAAAQRGPGFLTWEQLAPYTLGRHDAPQPLLAPFHRWRGARRAGREVAERPLLVGTTSAAIPAGDRP